MDSSYPITYQFFLYIGLALSVMIASCTAYIIAGFCMKHKRLRIEFNRYTFLSLCASSLIIGVGYIRFGPGFRYVEATLFMMAILVITMCDMMGRRIPNKIVMVTLLSGVVLHFFFFSGSSLLQSILGSVVGFFVMFGLQIVSRNNLGMGDVKLFAVIGFFLGWKSCLAAVLLTSIFGGIHALVYVSFKGFNEGSSIPYAPSAALASSLLLYGFQT